MLLRRRCRRWHAAGFLCATTEPFCPACPAGRVLLDTTHACSVSISPTTTPTALSRSQLRTTHGGPFGQASGPPRPARCSCESAPTALCSTLWALILAHQRAATLASHPRPPRRHPASSPAGAPRPPPGTWSSCARGPPYNPWTSTPPCCARAARAWGCRKRRRQLRHRWTDGMLARVGGRLRQRGRSTAVPCQPACRTILTQTLPPHYLLHPLFLTLQRTGRPYLLADLFHIETRSCSPVSYTFVRAQ